jgi:hypothetical protein
MNQSLFTYLFQINLILSKFVQNIFLLLEHLFCFVGDALEFNEVINIGFVIFTFDPEYCQLCYFMVDAVFIPFNF